MTLFSKRGLDLSGSRGFTLIELLVVIAIIGILSSVVLASLNSARKKGRDARRIADVKQLQLALELYYDSNPTTGYPTGLGTTASSVLITGGFISAIPTDPSTGAAFQYAALGSDTSCTGYHLGATLEVTGNPALLTDANFNSTAEGKCTNGGTGFDGASPVYDVKP